MFLQLFILLVRVGHHSLHMEAREQLEDSVLTSYHVDLRAQTQVVGLGGKCLYTLSHLTSSREFPKKIRACMIQITHYGGLDMKCLRKAMC